eukprot:2557901-Prymnesium_polylepis.1
MAAKDGLDLKTLLAGPPPAPVLDKGGGKGKGKGRGVPAAAPTGSLSRWHQMEQERAARDVAAGANAAKSGRGRGAQ